MQDWSIPLMVATAAFLVVLVWRVRPMVGWRQAGTSRADVREARARIDAAKDERERAIALCDAADLLAHGRAWRAKGLYLRAVRCDPNSAKIVERAVRGLRGRPRALEGVLWRQLAAVSWTETPESREATRAALDALRLLYEGPLRRSVRAKAIANARNALG